jgi:ribosomal protein S18 acetylase RimI-like enzyme
MKSLPSELTILRCYEIQIRDESGEIKTIGRAQISDSADDGQEPDTRYVTVVKIDKDYRRQRIATRLYRLIEADLAARELRLVKSNHQTDDAVSFWKKYRP